MFYHPDGGNIRTLHTAVVVQEAKALATAWAESDGGTGGAPAVVFCGDLNSDLNDDEGVCGAPRAIKRWPYRCDGDTLVRRLRPRGQPNAGAIQMLAEGRLSASHWEWAARANFDWDANDRGASVVGEGVHGAARNVDEAARGGDEVLLSAL